ARAAEDHRLVLCRSEAVYQAVATSGAKLPFGKSGGSPRRFIAAGRARGAENGSPPPTGGVSDESLGGGATASQLKGEGAGADALVRDLDVVRRPGLGVERARRERHAARLL